MVEIEAQIPPVSILGYFLKKVSAGRPDLYCGGAVADTGTWVTLNILCFCLIL